jgi:hypothetical protein
MTVERERKQPRSPKYELAPETGTQCLASPLSFLFSGLFVSPATHARRPDLPAIPGSSRVPTKRATPVFWSPENARAWSRSWSDTREAST